MIVRPQLLCFALCVTGCQGFDQAPKCGAIPSGGCPSSAGGSCEDRTCVAVYRCQTDGWILIETCPASDAGELDASDGGTPDALVCGDARAMESSAGCDGNELQNTDCPIEVAQGCPASACLTGCSDFYVCRDRVWLEAAYCDDDNELQWIDGF